MCQPKGNQSNNFHYDGDLVSKFYVSGILPRFFAARKPLPHDYFPNADTRNQSRYRVAAYHQESSMLPDIWNGGILE